MRCRSVIAVALALPLAALAASPAPRPKAVEVEFGEKFRLALGQTARLPGKRAFLRVERFVHSPCPKDARCVWSGLAVFHALFVDGKRVPPDQEPEHFVVELASSDYRTHAIFVVHPPSDKTSEGTESR